MMDRFDVIMWLVLLIGGAIMVSLIVYSVFGGGG